MATSQYTIYSSADPGGPGTMSAVAGDLLRILDACLVNGYTGKTAAGWTKPLANSGNCGCYQQGAGSQCILHINDNAPNVTASYREAWATGWGSLSAVGGVGTGAGQFPTPAQLLTTGHVVVSKSITNDSTARTWILFADSRTFILLTNYGYSGGQSLFHFGDIYSLSPLDTKNCLIIGRISENYFTNTNDYGGNHTWVTLSLPGHYMARPWGGTGTSTQVGKMGDLSYTASPLSNMSNLSGVGSAPNGPDNSFYLSPVKIVELGHVRGRMRGVYMLGHSTGLADGQVWGGGGDFAGKTFRVSGPVPYASYGQGAYNAYLAIETSATLETN